LQTRRQILGGAFYFLGMSIPSLFACFCARIFSATLNVRMPRAALWFVVLGISAVSASFPAFALDGDTQSWNTLNLTHKFDDQWSFNHETQGRFVDDASRFGLIVQRPSVNYRPNEVLSLTAGYAFFRVYEDGGGTSDEHRPWQQAVVRLFNEKDVLTINWRTRVEQRFFEGVDEPTWRLRQQLRAIAPLPIRDVSAVAWTEGFWRLNDTERADSGLEQWRWYGGLNYKLDARVTLEAGFMNIYTFRDRGDTLDHVPWLTTTVNF
jgi:hypothetical protein